MREARNAKEFTDRALAEAGVEVNVISGQEEARLIHLGVLQALPVFDQRLVLFDVGGGSTEVVFATGNDTAYQTALAYAAVGARCTVVDARTDTPAMAAACRVRHLADVALL